MDNKLNLPHNTIRVSWSLTSLFSTNTAISETNDTVRDKSSATAEMADRACVDRADNVLLI